MNKRGKLIAIFCVAVLAMLIFRVGTAKATPTPIEWTRNSTFVKGGYKWDRIVYGWCWDLDFFGIPIWTGKTSEVFPPDWDDANYARWPEDGVVKLAAFDPDALDLNDGRLASETYLPPAPTLHLVIDSENVDGYHEIADAIMKELEKININIVIDYRDEATINNTVWGDYWDKTWDEAPGLGWDMTWYEFCGAAEDLTSYYMSNATPPNGYNIMGWNNTGSDYILTEGIKETDPLLRQIYFWKWQEEYMWDMPGPVLYYLKYSPCCRGLAFNLHHPVLTNRYARQAIANAMPVRQIIQILDDWNIEALPGITPVHPTDPLFSKDLDYCGDNLDEARRLLAMWRDQTYAGDADFSGAVDLDDFLIWRKIAAGTNWNKPENWPWYRGDVIDPDFNNDAVADLSDYTLWITNYGTVYWTIHLSGGWPC